MDEIVSEKINKAKRLKSVLVELDMSEDLKFSFLLVLDDILELLQGGIYE